MTLLMKWFWTIEKDTVMIGSTKLDLETSRNANIESVFAKYGATNNDDISNDLYDYVINNPKDLLEIYK